MSQPPNAMTDNVRLVLHLAGAQRDDEDESAPTAIDILSVLFQQHKSAALYILDRVGVTIDPLASAFAEYDRDRALQYSDVFAIIKNAQLAAERSGSAIIATEHLLLGVLMCGDAGICEAFESQGIFVHEIILKAEPILREIAISKVT